MTNDESNPNSEVRKRTANATSILRSDFELRISFGFWNSSFGFLLRLSFGLLLPRGPWFARVNSNCPVFLGKIFFRDALHVGGGDGLDFDSGFVDFMPIPFPIVLYQVHENGIIRG